MRDITDIQRILNDYDAYLSVEKGMAENTREAYRRDIDKLHAWLTAGGLSLRPAVSLAWSLSMSRR